MMEIKIKYIKGYPTIKCITELILSFWGDTSHRPRISSYGFDGKLIWDRRGVNERIDDFALYLTEAGVEVKDYQLYNSPSTGCLQLKKQIPTP